MTSSILHSVGLEDRGWEETLCAVGVCGDIEGCEGVDIRADWTMTAEDLVGGVENICWFDVTAFGVLAGLTTVVGGVARGLIEDLASVSAEPDLRLSEETLSTLSPLVLVSVLILIRGRVEALFEHLSQIEASRRLDNRLEHDFISSNQLHK